MRPTRPNTLIMTALALVVFAACSGKKNKEAKDDPNALGGDVTKGGDDLAIDPNAPISLAPGTPAATALDELVVLILPELSSATGDCDKYRSSLSSFFATLSHQTRRLGDQAAKGIPPEELVKFSLWLNGRAEVFESMTVADEELMRVHRELTGTLVDLSESFALLVPSKEHPSTEGAGRRIENAVGNFKVTLSRLEKVCGEES